MTEKDPSAEAPVESPLTILLASRMIQRSVSLVSGRGGNSMVGSKNTLSATAVAGKDKTGRKRNFAKYTFFKFSFSTISGNKSNNSEISVFNNSNVNKSRNFSKYWDGVIALDLTFCDNSL